MQISFTPKRLDRKLTLDRQGDVLTINDEAFDFGPLKEGDTLPREAVACDWLASDVTRVDGELHLGLTLPHGNDAPKETRFPKPMSVTEDGPVDLPLYENSPGEDEE